MRRLTFKGFLAKYAKGLSYSDTLDLETLAAEAAENRRLRASLVLYAATHGKDAVLRKCLAGTEYGDGLCAMLSYMQGRDIERLLEDRQAPEEYLKAWDSFKASRAAPENEKALKAAMRKKILRLQEEKRCSSYRIYTDLGLNPGNVNSWLKHGDGSKVSYRTAERIVDYAMRYTP